MCFKEHKVDGSVALMIQAIDFSDLLDHNSNAAPQRVGYIRLEREYNMLGCGVAGSIILFVGGEFGQEEPSNIYWFDTRDPQAQIVPYPSELLCSKIEPYVVQLDDGKLYALSRVSTPGPDFEVFDPSMQRWFVLPEPPYDDIGRYFSPATDGTNIFLLCHQKNNVCCFSSSKRIWTTNARQYRHLCSYGPPSLVVKIDEMNDEMNDEKILFTYQFPPRASEEHSIEAFLLSDDGNMCLLNSLNFRQGVPSEFLGSQYQFVYLGGQYFCFLLCSYSARLPDHHDCIKLGCVSHQTDRMKICVLLFEFEYTLEKTDDQYHISFFQLYRRGTPRIVEYEYKYGEPNEHAYMIGAFMLGAAVERN